MAAADDRPDRSPIEGGFDVPDDLGVVVHDRDGASQQTPAGSAGRPAPELEGR